MNPSDPCPCDSQHAYGHCCGPVHASLGISATSAEQTMRSRYSAYVLNLEPHLLATWHVSKRPRAGELSRSQLKWLGLTVIQHQAIDESHAEVEFIARGRASTGKAERIHERSRFVRAEGRWQYVDAKVLD